MHNYLRRDEQYDSYNKRSLEKNACVWNGSRRMEIRAVLKINMND